MFNLKRQLICLALAFLTCQHVCHAQGIIPDHTFDLKGKNGTNATFTINKAYFLGNTTNYKFTLNEIEPDYNRFRLSVLWRHVESHELKGAVFTYKVPQKNDFPPPRIPEPDNGTNGTNETTEDPYLHPYWDSRVLSFKTEAHLR